MPNHGFKFKVQHLIMLWSFLANERERVLKNPLKLAIGYVTMGFHKVAPSYAHQANQHAAGSIDCQDIGKLPDPSAIWGQRGFAQIRQAEIRKKLIKRFITVLSDPVRNIQRYCNAAGNQSLHCGLYDFPVENWRHFRAPPSIESFFAAVKLRTKNQGLWSHKPGLFKFLSKQVCIAVSELMCALAYWFFSLESI